MVGSKKQEFWPRINIMKGKIKNLPMNVSSSKIEHDFNKKVVQKLTLEKMFLAKILIFLKEKKKKSIDFCHQKLTLYNFGTFDDLSFINRFFFLLVC